MGKTGRERWDRDVHGVRTARERWDGDAHKAGQAAPGVSTRPWGSAATAS